jgi:hypothetical protein
MSFERFEVNERYWPSINSEISHSFSKQARFAGSSSAEYDVGPL